MTLIFLLLALVVGISIPLQAGINGALGRALGNTYASTLTVFLLAAITTSGLLLSNRSMTLAAAFSSETPWWAWTGGLIAVLNVVLFIILPPKIGYAAFTGLLVLGQLAMAVAIDHFGMFGVTIAPLSPGRIAGILLILGGVYLVQKF